MSKHFNLLSLHSDTDIHPRTWICLRGKNLKNIFMGLKKVVMAENGLTKNALINLISSKYRCSPNTIGRIVYKGAKHYPLPIFLEMLKLCRNPKSFKETIIKNTEYLKVNSASANPVKAVKRLNKNIAKILGAFMADGSLSIQIVIAASNRTDLNNIKTEVQNYKINYSLGEAQSRSQFYISIQVNQNNMDNLNKLTSRGRKNIKIQTHFGIELTDAYRDSVEAFKNWLGEEFNIQPNRFDRKKDAWRVAFSNKILSRYFTKFFQIIPGPKTYTAFEPETIKNSGLSLRKAFAKGVLMFDGCVNKNRKILFSTVSNKLFESIKEIWGKDQIQFGSSVFKRRGKTEFCLFTTAKNKTTKLLEYFEAGTQKEKLIKWLEGNLNSEPIIKIRDDSLISVQNILNILGEVKKCDSEFLKKRFGCTHTTARIYLKILEKQHKIKLSNQPNGINIYVDSKTTVLLNTGYHNLIFQKIKNTFGTNENFAKFLVIHKATLSAWKVRKSRMPLYILKQFCNVLSMDYNQALKNVIRVDREIAEII